MRLNADLSSEYQLRRSLQHTIWHTTVTDDCMAVKQMALSHSTIHQLPVLTTKTEYNFH